MQQLLKSRFFRAAAMVALLVAIYAVAGFVVAPKIMRSQLLERIPASVDATPTVGEIRINPFLLQVTVNDFALERGGEKLLGFGRLFIHFQLSSIWHRAYTFAAIDLDAPYVNAKLGADGTLNLAQMVLKKTVPQAPPQHDAALPALRIDRFQVSRGFLTYEDHTHPDVFAARLEPIDFDLRDFTTGVAGGRFTFTGASKLGEKIEWRGHLSVQPVASDGEIQVDGLLAHTLWSYLEDQLKFTVNSGVIDLAAKYRFSLDSAAAGAVNLQADLTEASLTDLTVRPKGQAVDWITVPSLKISGATLDLGRRAAQVDSVALTGLKVLAWLEPDGSLNLQQLAGTPRVPGRPAAVPAPAAAPPATAPAAAAPWTFAVRRFDLREAHIAAEDRSVKPALKAELDPLSLHVEGVSQDLTKAVNVRLDTKINSRGSLVVSGEVVPQPASARLEIKLDGLDLAPLQPYIAKRTAMTLLRGTLGTDARVVYGPVGGAPSLKFSGNVTVDGLHTIDDGLRDDFIDWDRLEILGLDYTQAPGRLNVDRVILRKPYARVIVEPDASLNAKRVLAGPAQARPEADAGASPKASSAPGTPPDPGTPPKRGLPEPRARNKHGSPRERAAGPAHEAAAAPAMAMAIKSIELHAGQANFSDLSVTPHFSAGIKQLEGSVTGLSSKAGSRAKVDLHGAVDAFSPVSITGELNVLSAVLYTDLALSFHNIQLAVFNPYSGKFAGYNITKGKLTTDLHYKIDGRKLDAQHHIVVDQLEFGDKTASKDAVSLPIKLAVSLLKDRNGVIDLDFPVTGSLDDPKFRLGPLIWKVFLNILEKAVTAPFALLGSLFGAGPDLQFVDFQPGAPALDEADAGKMKTVAKALLERPQLKIVVPIAPVPELDRPALIAERLSAQLNEVEMAKASRRKKAAGGPAVAPYEQLDPAAKLDRLVRLYSAQTGGEPKFPDSVTALKAKPELNDAKIGFLEQAIREHIVIQDDDLLQLGKQRALAVQQALLGDTQIDPERVFLVVNDKGTAKDGRVHLELQLQ